MVSEVIETAIQEFYPEDLCKNVRLYVVFYHAVQGLSRQSGWSGFGWITISQ